MICEDRYGSLSGKFLRAVACCRESAWLQVSVEPSRRICRSSWRWNPPTTTLFPPTSPTGFSLDEEPATAPGMLVVEQASTHRQGRRRETGQSSCKSATTSTELANEDTCTYFVGVSTREGCALPNTRTK